MARNFDGFSDYLTGEPGALVGMDAGPITIAAIIKLDADSPGGSLVYCGGGGETGVDLGVYSGQFYLGSQEPALAAASAADGWHLVAAGKAAGTATPRWHKYVYSSETWTHTDAGSTMGDGVAVASGDTLQIGRWGTGSTRFIGSMEVIGIWNRVLSDAEIELLAFSLQSWTDLGPVAMWLLDQDSAATNVVDQTGGGANVTGGTGTTVATSSVPVFSYAAPIIAVGVDTSSTSRSVDDTVSAADAATGGVALPRAVAESVTAADAAAGAAGYTRPVGDGLTAGDSPTAGLALARAVAESATAADAVARLLALQRSVPDAITAGDSSVVAAHPLRIVGDTLTVEDSPDRSLARKTTAADGVGCTDAVTRGVSAARPVAQAVSLADTVVGQPGRGRDVSDSITLADLAFGSVGVGRGVSDTVTLADAAAGSVRNPPPIVRAYPHQVVMTSVPATVRRTA